MCDYSLCGIPNRLAVEGEELVVHRFYSGSLGLASPRDFPAPPDPAIKPGLWTRVKRWLDFGASQDPSQVVCMPPGAILILRDIPEDLRKLWMVSEEEGVRFLQVAQQSSENRDALRFVSGRQVPFQALSEGIRVDVLSFGCDTPPLGEPVRAAPAFR